MGRVDFLPERLPAKLTPQWRLGLTARGLGGVAATDRYVIVSDRDLADTMDVYHCLAADSGTILWTVRQPAAGNLDYGNTSRATPVIAEDRVYLFGAFGHLLCVELPTGKVLWQTALAVEFGPPQGRLPWGLCGTPLLVEGKLIVAPGSATASLAALDAATGAVLWKCPGGPPSYGSFIVATLGGVRQIVGHDADSLGGWDLATGRRRWQLVPRRQNDYNVPTPLVWNGHLIVSTENNGTRMFGFTQDGIIVAEPVAQTMDLAPETHSPVIVGDLLFGVHNELVCLDLKDGLRTRWRGDDAGFADHTTLVASTERLLIATMEGELLLIATDPASYRLLSRGLALPDEKDAYSHPAFVGTQVYWRGNEALYAFSLSER